MHRRIRILSGEVFQKKYLIATSVCVGCMREGKMKQEVNLGDSAEHTGSSYLPTFPSEFHANWKLILLSLLVKMVHKKFSRCCFNMLTIQMHLLVWDFRETWAGREGHLLNQDVTMVGSVRRCADRLQLTFPAGYYSSNMNFPPCVWTDMWLLDG